MANSWQKAYSRRNYRNKSKGAPYTPLGESNLTPQDAACDEMDDRILNLNTTKADQSDLLIAFKSVSFNSSTGVFTFTKFNDTTITVDTDIEKIAINFDYDDDPTSAHYQNLIITLDDGTVKYVDMSALITQYEFTDSTTIHFSVTNGVVSANIINGSITADHLAPSVMADINAAVNSAEGSAEDSEAWAVGQRDGSDVPSTDPAYQNNSKYYSGIAGDSAEDSEAYAVGQRGGTDVPSSDPTYHNNSKYYAEQAEASLSNTVRSFNSRTGAVVPVKGDYDISKITPTSGAVEGQIPVVVNNGTAQEPDYGFALGYASSSGIGSASLTLLNQRFSVTMNQKFSLVEGAYLAISFPNNDYPGHNKANLTIGNFGNIAVKVDGTVIPDSEEIGREEKILKAGETGLFVYDGTYLNLVDKNGSSGHSILDQNGTSMAQEDSLQFADSFVSDDDVNGKTVVENIKEHDTKADYDQATEDGFHVCDDGEDAVIHPSSDDKVEVEADGTKTWKQLYNELYGQIDVSKLTNNTRLEQGGQLFTRINDDTSSLIFVRSAVSQDTYGNKRLFNAQITLNSSASALVSLELYQNNTNSYDDRSNDTPANGTVITLYYGNKKAVVDLQTTANRCWYDSEKTVKQKIDESAESETELATGIIITRRGNVRVLSIITAKCNAVAGITIPEGDRPSAGNRGFTFYYLGYLGRIVISSSGTISIGHFATYGNTTVTDDSTSNNTINCTLVWAI